MVAEESTKYRWPVILLALIIAGAIVYGYFRTSNQNNPGGSPTPSSDISSESPTPTPILTPTPSPEAEAPYIKVSSQPLVESQLVIDKAGIDMPGFIVIHQNTSGKPGAVIGHSDLLSGEAENIKIAVNVAKSGTKVFAMLHYDADNNGTYDVSDEAVPVTVNENPVVEAITIVKAATPKPTSKTSPKISPKISPKASPKATPKASLTPKITPGPSGGSY